MGEEGRITLGKGGRYLITDLETLAAEADGEQYITAPPTFWRSGTRPTGSTSRPPGGSPRPRHLRARGRPAPHRHRRAVPPRRRAHCAGHVGRGSRSVRASSASSTRAGMRTPTGLRGRSGTTQSPSQGCTARPHGGGPVGCLGARAARDRPALRRPAGARSAGRGGVARSIQGGRVISSPGRSARGRPASVRASWPSASWAASSSASR